MDGLEEDINKLEKALYEALDDIDHRNRVAVLDVLSLILPPDSFKTIVEEAINILRINYYEGDDSQKEHVKYLIDFILHNESSISQTHYEPPA